MSDRYLNFANTKFGSKLTSMLGLPQPVELRRRDSDVALSQQTILLGSIDYDGDDFNKLERSLSAMGLSCVQSDSVTSEHLIQPTTERKSYDGLVFDARQLKTLTDSIKLHDFFHKHIRTLTKCGRIIVLGITPQICKIKEQRMAQAGLPGLIRSLAKECRKGSTAQLVYEQIAGEAKLESTLRFLLSGASAYVSGQAIYLEKRVGDGNNIARGLDRPSDLLLDWDLPLKNQKILVTGASQGIGLAIAELMVDLGADVYCLDIPQNQTALDSVSSRLDAKAIALDISSDEAPSVLLEYGNKIGGWDVLVHNAGITRDKTIANMSDKAWQQVVDVNLAAQQRINDRLLDNNGFTQGGRIICVSSISGIAGNRGQTNYAYSKAGVIGMVHAYANDLRERDMTINAVAPGFIETQMTGVIPFAVREAGRRLNSLSQGGQPQDVAQVIAWFANPASCAVNGNVVRVCGQSLLGA